MFNTFIGTKFNVFGTFENFDLMGLVLTKGVIYTSASINTSAPCCKVFEDGSSNYARFIVTRYEGEAFV